MTSRWTDHEFALRVSDNLRFRGMRVGYSDAVLLESMDSFEVGCKFLTAFLCYTHHWSDASKVVPNLDSLVIKVAATMKAFRKDLHNVFVDIRGNNYFLERPSKCTVGFAKLWRSTRHRIPIACYCSDPSTESLNDIFARLNEKIELLKPQIREAYNRHLSTHPFHPLRPSCFSNSSDLAYFCECVEWNLQFLSEKSDIVGPLGKHMKALKENLYSLRLFLKPGCCLWYPWKDNMMAQFCAVAVRAAHVCCLCWFAEMDQNLENDMKILLVDLQQKIDLASPDFLAIILEFLCKSNSNSYIVWLVDRMLGVPEKNVLHDDLVSLITCLVKILMMPIRDEHRFSVDIKAVIKEARHLKGKDYTACKNDFVILFARIWFLKAEIFLNEQLNGSTLMLSMEDQIKALEEGSRILGCLTPTTGKTENCILALTEEVPRQVESLSQSSHAEAFIGNKVRDVLYKFFVNLMLFKAKALLLELPNEDASLMVPVNHQIRTLHEGLIFVIEASINQRMENTEEEKLILTYCDAVATGVISFCNSFPAEEITEEAVKNLGLRLSNMLEMIPLLKTKLEELYLQVPRINFPKTPGLGFMEFLLKKLTKLLSDKVDSFASVTHQIEALCGDLEFLISLFRNVTEQSTENQEQKDNCERLINLTYEAEYVIDSMVVENAAEWHHLLWLYHVSEEIRHIRVQVTDIYEEKGYDIVIHRVPQTQRPLLLQDATPRVNEDVVVLNDQQQVIIDLLTRGSLQRDIVSIVGMPGIGKTTLANKVYDDPAVFCYFHVRAWCCISQEYRKRKLLLEILRHIIELTDTILAMDDEDLKSVLYKRLKQNRYLIVMDDMWDIEPWEDLQSSIPDDGNGSRILITSRLHDLVPQVTLGGNLLNLRPLSDGESWELLKMKIFHEEDCPKELLEVGMDIARNCKGLPLSLVAIAGVLNRKEKKQELWRQIVESLNSLIVCDQQTRCMDILELSYNHLPDDLKACFLYLGIFEEDKEFPVSRLMWLWMAEGFIQEKDSKSLEDLAQDYLMDLIGRSLVIAAKRRSNGEVKACRVHDMVRNLCLLKAEQENFLELVTINDEPYASFDDSVDFDDFDPSSSMTYKGHRLCFWARRKHFVMSRPSGQYVRSLLFFASTDTYPRCPYDVSFISKNFVLLKVLDLQCINMGSTFADGIELLVQLSYLAVGGDIDSIPSSLVELRNLETFLVKGLKGKVVLPDSIWRMTRLRHLHVDNHAIFTLQNDMTGSYHQLNNLVSLSSPSLSILNGEHAEEIIKRLPNLRRLICILSKSGNYLQDLLSFPRFEHLTRLESLKISYHGKTLNMSEFNFPLSLKKLTLSNFCMRWDHIATIGSLEKLEVLKLLSVDLEDARWEMREGEFPKLKFLKLDSLNIEEWNASSGDLPELQHLVLRKCKKLTEVPFDFVDIPTLRIIEVLQCGVSLEESVRGLKEEQLGYGIEDLKVLINH